MNTIVKRGDIFYADLSPVVGSEQGGLRPVLVIQNDMGNRYSPTVIAAAITSRLGKTKLPTHVDVFASRAGLARDSIVLLEQLRTLDKQRLREHLGHLDETLMREVDTAVAVSLGLLPHSARTQETPRTARVIATPLPALGTGAGANEKPAAAVAAATTPQAD